MKVGDKMDFFEALEWKNWKILSDELRMQVMNQVLMYFVSPLKYVSDVEYKEFSLSGVKCQTFECSIDGERFVLVPGNKEAILGWNFGTQGLPVTTWDQKAHTLRNEYQKMKTSYHLKTTEDWDVFVNESTSPLRKVAISPMLVQKEASPVGTTYLGEFNLVTGEFTGEVESFLPIKNQLSPHFCVPESLEACLSFEVPNQLFKKNCYYGQLQLETDTYRLFSHQACTHQTLKQQVHDQVYDLLTEDEWEYVNGGGTRRLFRWSNELDQGNHYQGRQVTRKMSQVNMFGLRFATKRQGWELTDSDYLKLEKWADTGIPLFDYLPLASYYRSRQILAKEKELSPLEYSYRKAIIIRQE